MFTGKGFRQTNDKINPFFRGRGRCTWAVSDISFSHWMTCIGSCIG